MLRRGEAITKMPADTGADGAAEIPGAEPAANAIAGGKPSSRAWSCRIRV